MHPKQDFCETCKFWVRISVYDGYCYKYAPHIVVGDSTKDHQTYERPITKVSDWCGDWAKLV